MVNNIQDQRGIIQVACHAIWLIQRTQYVYEDYETSLASIHR